jgi:hypothetical protein
MVGKGLKSNEMFLSRKESTDLLRTAYSPKDSSINMGEGDETIVTAALKTKDSSIAGNSKPTTPKAPTGTPTAANGSAPKTQS